jgi:hypothetical protein
MQPPSPLEDILVAIHILAQSGDDAAVRVAEALEKWRRREVKTIDEALGLPDDWWTAGRRAIRNRALGYLAESYFPKLSGRTLASAVHRALHRYETTSWPRDYKTMRRPDNISGALYDVLNNGGCPSYELLRKLYCNKKDQTDKYDGDLHRISRESQPSRVAAPVKSG